METEHIEPGIELDRTTKSGRLRPEWIWGFLALPLLVYFLPRFQTYFQEDLLLLGTFFYIFLRTGNHCRRPVPAHVLPLLYTLLLGILYAVGWFGLLRGYQESLGRWLVLYPLPLLFALYYFTKNSLQTDSLYRLLIKSTAILSILLFGITGFFYGVAGPAVWNTPPFAGASKIPALLVFPIIGCVALVSNRIPPLVRGRDHLPLFILALIVMVCVWGGNSKTWLMWYQAGQTERAWTPFKYEDPIEIARVERKPHEAAVIYNQVRERILEKGPIPRYMNWPFFLKYRMAYQFMRKKEPWICAKVLPPATLSEPRHINFVKNMWHLEFLWSTLDGKPDYPEYGRIWVDGERDSKNSIFLLDCFGRVYSIQDGLFWMEWDPEILITDAVDLELHDNIFVILRCNGDILTSKSMALFQEQFHFPAGYDEVVDLEFFNDDMAAVVINRYGDMHVYGTPPAAFPSSDKLHFNVPVAADVELEPFGNGYYLLDIHGAVHANHAGGTPSIPNTNPPVPKPLLPYWMNLNMAIDLELDPYGRGLYVYNRLGELYTIALSPYRETYRPAKAYPYRGVSLLLDNNGSLFSLESNGQVITIP